MRQRRFHSITLGCKLNQFDTAAIEGELSRRGYVPSADPSSSGVVVVNTCTVTSKADSEARRIIRRVRRSNPDCRVLVTGCYAERDAGAIEAIPGVDIVFGNRAKDRIGEILDDIGIVDDSRGTASTDPGDRGCDASARLPEAVHFGERSRAFLKIQEGCDLRCSYCVIPEVRGPSRSVEPDRVARGVLSLTSAGYREVVLTGVNTGDYGKDLVPRTSLEELLGRLLAACGPNRIRLNSLEPRTVTDGIIGLMADDPRLAPHLQVPLQSGSDPVLHAMRRNYRTALYLERLERLRQRIPDVGLGADVIVGFPGETDDLFEQTFRFVANSPLNYLHVFSWSPRPGTPASSLAGRVPNSRVRERVARLRALGGVLGTRFRESLVGREFDAVVLSGPSRNGRTRRALTGNFVEVLLPSESAVAGSLIDVSIERVDRDGTTWAAPAGRPPWSTSTEPPPDKRNPDRIAPVGATVRLRSSGTTSAS